MSQEVLTNDDDIDLLSFIFTIWEEKITIIGFVILSTLIGVGWTLSIPQNYEVLTIVKPAHRSVFNNYTPINDILQSSGIGLSEDNKDGYLIDTKVVFNLIISEFNDYEEMISILKKNEFVKQEIDGLSNLEKRRTLINFAKRYVISAPKNNYEKEWIASFIWHDIKKKKNLFNAALKLTGLNVKNTISSDISSMALSLD